MKKQCKNISIKPRKFNKIRLNFSINPETIPTLIPDEKLKIIQAGDADPFYVPEEIKDISKPANGVEFTREFWESYLAVLKERPIPGRKKGHLAPYSYETAENDFYVVGGKIEGNKVFLKNYIPPEGFETSNKGFIRDIKAGLIHFSVVSWTEDIIDRDENGSVKSIKAIKSVKGERNDAVEVNMGAMKQKVNIVDIKMNPYPNEHAARVKDPGDFEENSFRRKNIADGIDIIVGKLKGKKTTTTQAYRFDAKKFTVKEAKKWLKDHNISYISFEPASGENKSEKEDYIMPDNVYSDIMKNLKNQLDNGTVSKIQLAKDFGIEVSTDEQKTAVKILKEITDITGENPVEKIKQMKSDETKIKQQAYDNIREKLMTETFGPEKIKVNGKDEANLIREAADPHVSHEIQDEKKLKEQIEKTKENPVVKQLSFQRADVNSGMNDITGMKISTGHDIRTSEVVEI